MISINRRELLELTGLSLAAPTAGRAASAENPAAASQAQANALAPLNRFPRMMQEYMVGRVRDSERRANEAKRALKTRQDAEAYVRSVRERIQACFGPLPEKTPLNARTTRTVERDTYRIENVIFESRPRFQVTGNLYVPKGRKPPYPAVVGSCGHSVNGKAAVAYQSFAQGLARLGYVVLLIDPIGQGERLQYIDAGLKPRRGTGTSEHLYAGNQQYLVGEFLGTWRAWDGIRALDYLLARPEVDRRHLGVTGTSGGGTLTAWLCGLEQRWTMAAPGCFITTFRRNLENELPADTEQCPPRAISLGLNHEDFIAALAPKPVILLAKERDYFDIRGSEEAFQRLQHLYRLLGAEDRISLSVGPTEHGYSQEHREAMYRWFNRCTGLGEVAKEPDLVIEKDETLWCSPGGQVTGPDSRTIYSFTEESSKALRKQRPVLSAGDLAGALRKALRLPERHGIPEYRILRPAGNRGYPLPQSTTYAVETEPGVFALVYRLSREARLSRPPRTAQPAVLYIAHHSADAELREEPLIRELLASEPDAIFYACDVRGIGESLPNTCGPGGPFSPYGGDYFYATHGLMLDYPMAGQRTHDVLSVIDWLAGFDHPTVHLAGKGWGAVPAALAATVSASVGRVTLKNAPRSWSEIAESEDYNWPLALLPDGVLRHFDLPDCYRLLEQKGIRQIDPVGARP